MRATIVRTTELRHASDDPAEDRSAHVRAASGIARHRGRHVVVQDDASFLAVVGADGVEAIPLPRGRDGRRRFETRLGNKQLKLDLEACCPIGDAVYAFGSGSTPARETIVRLTDGVELMPAPALYAAVRAAVGGDINVEGAAYLHDTVHLFHRGNCTSDDRPACIRVDLAAQRVLGVERFDLGSIGGVRLGFTDAVAVGDAIVYLAAAEASPNAVDDGVVHGTQIGVITATAIRATPLGTMKAEGISIDPDVRDRAFVVEDPDDPDAPSKLYELALAGFDL